MTEIVPKYLNSHLNVSQLSEFSILAQLIDL